MKDEGQTLALRAGCVWPADETEWATNVRIKHRMNHNSVKMYDKQGSVLRVETTINDAHDLSVYRARETDPHGPKQWQRLRKGIADLPRRARISRAANARYLDALAKVDAKTPLGEVADAVAGPVFRNGRRYRGLRPLSGPDAELAEVLLDGCGIGNSYQYFLGFGRTPRQAIRLLWAEPTAGRNHAEPVP